MYKRQVYANLNVSAHNDKALKIFDGQYFTGANTVSYTHLDVYKRQPLCNVPQETLQNPGHAINLPIPKTPLLRHIPRYGQNVALLLPLSHRAEYERVLYYIVVTT